MPNGGMDGVQKGSSASRITGDDGDGAVDVSVGISNGIQVLIVNNRLLYENFSSSLFLFCYQAIE